MFIYGYWDLISNLNIESEDLMSKGTDFEDWLESEGIKAYDDHKIRSYEREELKSNIKRGRRVQGKHDFKFTLNDDRILILECKSVDVPSRMTTEYGSTPMIKKHQLKALRENVKKGGVSAFLLQYRRTDKIYMMLIDDFDNIIIKNGLIKSIKEEWLTRQITGFDDILREVE
jgi:penicillin-binding protein-related factor A (putative recombinase)